MGYRPRVSTIQLQWQYADNYCQKQFDSISQAKGWRNWICLEKNEYVSEHDFFEKSNNRIFLVMGFDPIPLAVMMPAYNDFVFKERQYSIS